ncbi:MAG TPA: DUF6483 family protein [Ruminococcus flavefaciens]|nr:DUF6483 family protein [Ruminococcus flavefaciens]HQM01647.1 DUF6483 family protein [Ruminococcus flavefaciens]
MFEQDYIMRQIKEITAVMAKVLFNAKVEDSFVMLQEAEKQQVFNLVEMTRNGKLKDAVEEVDRLTDNNTKENLMIGLSFYNYLNDIPEYIFTENEYNSARLRKDFRKFVNKFGLSQMTDLYFGEEE